MEIPSMPTSNCPSRTAWIMVSHEVMFQAIFALRRFPISFTASYSQPTALPVLSTKFSGVKAFSVTALMTLPLRSESALVCPKADTAISAASAAKTILFMLFSFSSPKYRNCRSRSRRRHSHGVRMPRSTVAGVAANATGYECHGVPWPVWPW